MEGRPLQQTRNPCDLDYTEICKDSDGYPPLLREIADPPARLYVRGDAALLSRPQIAIVGSRRATPSGESQARRFASELGRAGLVITSGLASGIDTAAHLGALAAPVATVAVMGTGPDQIYPSRNRQLADRILAAAGALVTEFPPGTPPRSHHFPRRNRIISGLSLGVLVVEASERSGSLITARLALEQGREVFAVPGNIDNPLARGCHRLIRDGAALAESTEDLLAELQSLLGFQLEQAGMRNGSETPSMADPVLDALGWELTSPDQLAERTGMPMSELLDRLLELELSGQVATSAGGYQRIGKH